LATYVVYSNDFYTTIINNEIIVFESPLSSITIEAKYQIPIKINNSEIITTSFLIITNELINSLQIMALSGTEIKWSGTVF